MRQQKALEKADEIAGRLEKKVGDSKKRSKRVQARAADWDELNGKGMGTKEKKKVSGKGDETKPMEGVLLPDLEQPLPLRSAEVSAAEDMPVEKQAPETAEPEEDEVL